MKVAPTNPDGATTQVALEIVSLACHKLSTARLPVTPQDVLGGSRLSSVSRVRMACYRAMYTFYPNYSRVGAWLNKDHSSASYGVARADRMVGEDPKFARVVQELDSYAKSRELSLRGQLVAEAFRVRAEQRELAKASSPALSCGQPQG